MKISRVAEMRALDTTAVEKFGIAEALLMENAGLAAFAVLSDNVGVPNKKFTLFCGMGNNGGDGFVVARKIHSNGGAVKIFVLGDPARFSGAARQNLDIVHRLGLTVEQLVKADAIDGDLRNCDAIVDALLGTGIARDVTGLYRDVIERINRSAKKVLSIDIPSGINGDTGSIMGCAVQADYTVTFGLPKIGNMLFPGFAACGRQYVTHISFPPEMVAGEALKIQISPRIPVPPRNKTGHKGSFGQVLFIAGAAGYFGAPYFAAMSFLKAGGGYARLAAPAAMTPFIASKGSEIVFLPQKETTSGSISFENKHALLALAEKMDLVVLGPGLSLETETQQLARELAAEITRPLIVDGDAISAVCKDLNVIRRREGATIITPHPGEMSRITKKTTREIERHRIDVLQQTARDLNAVIVLKGAHSLIGGPDERVFINLSGNSGMATAGSGDVLTGAIAAMFGLGLPVTDAVIKGVFLHGLAGDLAARIQGEDGLTAQDILEALPAALQKDREGLRGPLGRRYDGPAVV